MCVCICCAQIGGKKQKATKLQTHKRPANDPLKKKATNSVQLFPHKSPWPRKSRQKHLENKAALFSNQRRELRAAEELPAQQAPELGVLDRLVWSPKSNASASEGRGRLALPSQASAKWSGLTCLVTMRTPVQTSEILQGLPV